MSRLTPMLLGTLLVGCSYGGSNDSPLRHGGVPQSTVSPADVVDSEDPPEDPEVECDNEAPVVLYVSPDDSNSMSSPVQAREWALTGGAQWTPIRTWEFLNYATWDYAPSATPGELALDVQLAQGEHAGEYTMQVGISSERVDAALRPPVNLTMSVDQSGSMSGEPMDRVKDALRAINGSLLEGDVISVVLWSNDADVALDGHVATGPDDPVFAKAIASLATGGGTDLSGGLQRAYQVAERNDHPARINRVLLLSDGGANIGVTDADVIGGHAEDIDQEGIYMVGVGAGSAASYNDALMDTVTDLGRGASVFIPSADEAQRMFGDRFLEVVGTAARDVQISYTLPPGFEVVRFSGEEISRNPEEVRPQHLAPNDSMVLHQHLETCAKTPLGAEITVTVSYRDAVTFEERSVGVTSTVGELLDKDAPQLWKGAAVFAYAETLKGAEGAANRVRVALERAEEANPGDADLAEMRQVLAAL